ncbi:MAG: transglutaminase-like domain-containing protein, partial [Nitrospirota bacterium]
TVERDPMFGNRMVHVASGREPESFAVESRYRVVRRRLGPQAAQLEPAAANKYLRFTGRLRITEEIEAFTRRVVGAATAPREVARRVYDGLVDYLTYDKEIPGCGTGDTEWVMRHRRGKCDDYHALFTAILRSRGIPVRWEQGFPLPYPADGPTASGELSGDCSGAHCWVSFYDPESGWVPVDMSEGDKHPELHDFFFGHLTPNRFQISEGRSLTLAPAQVSGPLPTFAYAYIEADGIPLIYKANYDNVVQFNVTRFETA